MSSRHRKGGTRPASTTIALSDKLERFLVREMKNRHINGKSELLSKLAEEYDFPQFDAAIILALSREPTEYRRTDWPRRIELGEAATTALRAVGAKIPTAYRPTSDSLTAALVVLVAMRKAGYAV